MNFKKIELFGFKSFADKVEVEFNDGITGIVGPNGCGKSNVADAIRWVLGEQSARLLRGKSMQDVIFNGTQRRKPLSFCEVSLIFDNTNKIFPSFEYQEVIITRRLYRSGESEYLINRTNCRLKDIQDLIRDTGLGREGYSIVGQGRVDEIVNARPKDRRSIFEDAAGILKFKQRKIESEKKLERTQENIQQLEYVIQESERLLGPLSKQAENAKKFLKLRDELKELEVNDYIYKFDNNDNQRQVIQDKLTNIGTKINLNNDSKKKIDEEYAAKDSELSKVDTYIGQLRDRQTEMAVNNEAIRGQGNTLNERISQLQSQKSDYSQRIAGYENDIEEKNKALVSAKSKVNMALEDKNEKDQELKDKDALYLKLVDEVLFREKEIEESNVELLKELASLGDIKEDLGKLNKEKELTLVRIGELAQEINTAHSQLEVEEKLKKNYEETVSTYLKDKRMLAENKNEVLSELITLKENLAKERKNSNDLIGRINNFEAQDRLLTELMNDYGRFNDSVKNLMQATKEIPEVKAKVQGLIAELIKVPKELETAIEMALGNSMQNIVTKDENDAKDLIDFLRFHHYGRVTFLPLTSYKPKELELMFMPILKEEGCLGIASKLIKYDHKYDNIFSGLLGRTLIVDTMDNAIAISRKYKYAVKIVTLMGDIINPSGSLTGGSKKSEAGSIFGQERKLEDIKKLLEQARKDYAKSTATIEEGSETLEELEAQLAEYEDEVKAAEIAYATENGKLDKVQAKIDDLLEQLHKNTKTKDILETKIQAIDEAISNKDSKSIGVNEKHSNSDDEALKKKAEFDDKKRKRDLLSEEISKLKVELGTIDAQLVGYNADVERIEGEIKQIEALKSNAKTFVETLEQRIYQTENNLNTAVVSEEDQKKYNELIERIASLDKYKGDLKNELSKLAQQKEEINAEFIKLNEAKIKQENSLEKLAETMSNLEIYIAEEYELDYRSCLQFKKEDFDPVKAHAEIARLKKEKNALGPINMEAIEQYKAEGEIYEERKNQRDDMVQTAEDLKKIIAEMSKEMKTRFDSEFAKINANFQSIFKELFGGGSGNLVIEDVEEGEDPLDAGVEIFAAPPGKSVKSITLFSGGEKALIAIAILFAILKLKAMPFCVLDEIEAALDDANAGLFAKYLGRFSKETQFIVITHRKPTMELADRLYGVTMQEQGVSKMVSVSLEEAVKNSASSDN